MKNNIPPVLFLIFKRLETTKQVFQAIRKAQPSQLFIAADGPKPEKSGEKEKTDAVRKYVLDNIDWDCDVKTRFQEKNLGCGLGVSSAISWFFNQVEEGIILEDDCLPHPDFFEYCKELLDKYRNNKDIAIICGSNFNHGKKFGDASYFFTKYTYVWGWATWKRTWENYQYDVNLLDKHLLFEKIDKALGSRMERFYWKSVFEKMSKFCIDTWDYQFCFHIWYHDMYSIAPNVNLIQNIDSGKDATHPDPNTKSTFIKTEPILPLEHPSKIRINKVAGNYYFNKYLNTSSFFEKIIREVYIRIPSPILLKYKIIKNKLKI
ncbi:MAG: nucleotide-diphospho-sugar transferase [Dysgonamonadaceae bacterium]|jgi:hypothetical protein|nr:nucleotide-diphospho-sugar transferase [Dysgonamonadaceae bacterium]